MLLLCSSKVTLPYTAITEKRKRKKEEEKKNPNKQIHVTWLKTTPREAILTHWLSAALFVATIPAGIITTNSATDSEKVNCYRIYWLIRDVSHTAASLEWVKSCHTTGTETRKTIRCCVPLTRSTLTFVQGHTTSVDFPDLRWQRLLCGE